MPLFRWLHRRGPTRSHPEHGSQALQSRWYCMVSMWESRSLPEFLVARIERALPQRRPAAVSSKLQPRGVAFSRPGRTRMLMALLAVLAPAPRAPAPLEVTLREPAL